MFRVMACIWKKEFLEILRDRRMIVFVVAFPCLIMPLMCIGITYASSKFQQTLTGQKVTVVIDNDVPSEAVAALAGEGRFQLERRAISHNEKTTPNCHKDCIVISARSMPVSAQPSPRSDTPGQLEVTIRFDGSEPSQLLAQRKVHKILNDLARDAAIQSRLHHGIAESVAEPVVVKLTDTGSKSDLFAKVLRFVLPLFIMLALSTACVNPAIDFTAGEWERGTLERLLMTPAPRTAIMTGKILAASTIGYASGALNAISFHALLSSGTVTLAGEAGATAGAFPLSGLVHLLIHLIPAALMLSAAGTILAVAARSYKAAQSASSYIMLGTIALTAVGLAPNQGSAWGQLAIPVANVAAVLRQGFMGELSPTASLAVFTLNMVVALALAALSARLQPRVLNTAL